MCMKTEIQDNKNQLFLEKNPYVLKIVSFLCPVAESLFTLSPLKTEVPSVPLFAQNLGRPLTSMQGLCKVCVCLCISYKMCGCLYMLQGGCLCRGYKVGVYLWMCYKVPGCLCMFHGRCQPVHELLVGCLCTCHKVGGCLCICYKMGVYLWMLQGGCVIRWVHVCSMCGCVRVGVVIGR